MLEVLAGAIGIVVFLVTVYAGIAGTDEQSQNLAPTSIYVLFWVGVPFASLIFGDIWQFFSPWRSIGRAVGWIAARVSDEMPEPLEYPARVGRFPAAAVIFGFAICELCWARAELPGPLAVIALLYLIVMLIGQSLYGVDGWTRNADGFGVLWSLIGSLSPLAVDENRKVVGRIPGTGAARLDLGVGTAALLIVSIGSTAFDGAKEGALFNNLAKDLQRFYRDLHMSIGPALEWGFVTGLAGAVLIVAAIWTLGMLGMNLPESVPDRRTLSRRFTHTLIPIAAGYLVAHYFSLLAYNGQDLWRLASDPLGHGSDLFGSAQRNIDYGIINATGIWYVQIVALVAGHVAGLVLAHDRALELYGSARAATRSQVVMLILMVAFTCLGLWLLSAALHA